MADDPKIRRAREDERRRCAAIMTMAEAKAAPKAAAEIAFGTDMDLVAARAKLREAATAAQTPRERGRASMRKECGLPQEGPITYTPGQISALRATARGGLPGSREAAAAMLKKAGITL